LNTPIKKDKYDSFNLSDFLYVRSIPALPTLHYNNVLSRNLPSQTLSDRKDTSRDASIDDPYAGISQKTNQKSCFSLTTSGGKNL